MQPSSHSSRSPQRLPLTAPARSDSVSSDSSVKSGGIPASVAALNIEAAVGCASSQSRRHGRFTVQPLMDSNLSTTPTSVRAPSPANCTGSKPPLGPNKVLCSPTPSSAFISERRPSRIIGRFEVCELFSEDAKTSCYPQIANSPTRKPAEDLISMDLGGATETSATTPIKGE